MKHPLRKVVIPAAGLGTRFLPATKAVPKEMLPIVDTPTIQLIVEEAVKAGAGQVIVVNGRGKSSIEDHCDLVRLISVRQNEPLGLGHAVLAARPAVGDEWFGVLLGDDLIDSDEPGIGQLARVAMQTGKAAVALMPVADDQTHLYGVAAGKALPDGNILVERIVEKPPRGSAPSNLAVVGRYLLPPDVFAILEQVKPGAGGEIQLTDALAVLAQQGRLIGVRFKGERHDAGDRLGYLIANVAYALKRPELRDGLLAYLKKVVQ
jgi:UTP--glucose-1-phosphate uridylyltransferase